MKKILPYRIRDQPWVKNSYAKAMTGSVKNKFFSLCLLFNRLLFSALYFESG